MTQPQRKFSDSPTWAKIAALTIVIATPVLLGSTITLLVILLNK